MWARRCQRVLKRIRGGKLLDVGAGIGTPLHMFRQVGFECVGTEISSKAIERAKELYHLDLLYGYVENLYLGNDGFDVITMWHVFEHLPYPGNTLDYLNKKLKKGGYIFLAVPNNSFWRKFYSPRFLLASKRKKLETLIPCLTYESKFKEIHLIHFNPKSLREIVEQHGLKVEELTMDNISLNPGIIKDAKYYFRNLLAKHLHIYTHEALFCARRRYDIIVAYRIGWRRCIFSS